MLEYLEKLNQQDTLTSMSTMVPTNHHVWITKVILYFTISLLWIIFLYNSSVYSGKQDNEILDVLDNLLVCLRLLYPIVFDSVNSKKLFFYQTIATTQCWNLLTPLILETTIDNPFIHIISCEGGLKWPKRYVKPTTAYTNSIHSKHIPKVEKLLFKQGSSTKSWDTRIS